VAYRALLFDLSDTLIREIPTQAQHFAERLRLWGFSISEATERAIGSCMAEAAQEQIAWEEQGAPRMDDADFERLLARAAAACADADPEALEGIADFILAAPPPSTQWVAIPGAVAVLDALQQRGYRLGVVSNHRAWMRSLLQDMGLAAYFEQIIISACVGVEKPDPRIMEMAVTGLKLSPAECLYIGDHPFDVLCAKRAGVGCAWIADAAASLPASVPFCEDYRIQALEELLTILP
jgi:putative hydrolase of the HAD superfamily